MSSRARESGCSRDSRTLGAPEDVQALDRCSLHIGKLMLFMALEPREGVRSSQLVHCAQVGSSAPFQASGLDCGRKFRREIGQVLNCS